VTYIRKTSRLKATPEVNARIWTWYCQKKALGTMRTLAVELGMSARYVELLIDRERRRREIA
jgi:hypothetical protein